MESDPFSYLSLAHKMSSLFLSWTAGAVYLLGCFGGGVIERSHSAILSARLSIHRLFKVLFMYINDGVYEYKHLVYSVSECEVKPFLKFLDRPI
jgi:hypothetical protein